MTIVYRCRYCKRKFESEIGDGQILPRDRCMVGSTGRGGTHLWKRMK